MLSAIAQHLREKIHNFPAEDSLIFNGGKVAINPSHFQPIPSPQQNLTIAFLDGGQAEILLAGNFCLSFLRIRALVMKGLVMKGNAKMGDQLHEFYALTTTQYKDNEIWYETKLFPSRGTLLIPEEDLSISSHDDTLKIGRQRVPIELVSSMARRFAELALATHTKADFVMMDGTLEASYAGEEKYLQKLPAHVSALAKTSSLCTVSGNSPFVLLNKIAPSGCWYYNVEGSTSLVKLHEKAKHAFRFTGNPDVLPLLAENSRDAVFLGYPYGLVLIDKLARVSNEEKSMLRHQLLLRQENKDIVEYLSTMDAHEILDSL